jgi:hypothetical protein
MRNQVSYSYVKQMVLYVSVIAFLYRRQEDERSELKVARIP